MRKRLLSTRAGIDTWYVPQSDGTFVIETTQDVAPIIERNKRAQVEFGKNTRGRDIFPVASVPVVVQYEWLTKHGVNLLDPEHEKAVKRLLNSSEYRYLKTSEIIL
jgi:hypothetical protein